MFANNPHIPSCVLYYGDVNPVETDVALGCLGNKDKIKAMFLADANIFSNNSGPLGVKLTVDTPRHEGRSYFVFCSSTFLFLILGLLAPYPSHCLPSLCFFPLGSC